MLAWVLMILDLIVLFIVSTAHFGNNFPFLLLLYSAIYLIIKFLIFREIMSGIDAVFGIYIIIMAIFQFSSFVYYLLAGWFLYKLISLITV